MTCHKLTVSLPDSIAAELPAGEDWILNRFDPGSGNVEFITAAGRRHTVRGCRADPDCPCLPTK
jgi:hypothetical protein